MPEERADTFLRLIRRAGRGRLKVYLGYGAGVLAGDGAQGGAGDGFGVGLGDLVRVEGVVVVTDDKGGDFDGLPILD